MFKRIAAAVLSLAALALAPAAQAQSGYPTRPVRLVVPFPTGQATDVAARLVAEALSKEWGQQIVVENRGGGAGVPGMVYGRDQPADGYTLVMGTSAVLVVNPAIIEKLPYDPLNDFVLVGPVFRNPLIVVAVEGSPIRSLKDLVDEAKRNPGKLQWGYPGAGTTQHLTGELFKQVAGVDIQGVMYKGSAAVVTDMLGGHIQLAIDGVPAHLTQIKAGKIRALASTGATRAPQLPDVPTIAELGYPGFSGEGWGGVVAPKGTPADIVAKVARDLRKVMSDPAMQQRIVENGLVVDNMPREEWLAFARQTHQQWGDVARRNNIKVQ
ncbi:MAG TPA: tripartite tricarboxylate transporter substrate binding protein [Burkholderiaceae bacterium]|nr:tripartite tricarboxylate transporter substrate binding protein [Burkholderiaceae bacterium]